MLMKVLIIKTKPIVPSKFFWDIPIYTASSMDLINFEKDLYVSNCDFFLNLVLTKAVLLLLFTLLMTNVDL